MKEFLSSLAFTLKANLAKIGIGRLGIGLLVLAPFAVGVGKLIGNKISERNLLPLRAIHEEYERATKMAREETDAKIRENDRKFEELFRGIRGGPQTPHQGPHDAVSEFHKHLGQMRKGLYQTREQWQDRAVKTLVPIAARVKIGFLTGAQSDVLQQYIGTFERIYADAIIQTNAIEMDLVNVASTFASLSDRLSEEEIWTNAQEMAKLLKSINLRTKLLGQLDNEWIETGRECNRRLKDVNLD